MTGKRPTGAPGRVREITSLANPEIKAIRALALKKHRAETGLFMAEGLKLVIDALDSGWTMSTFLHAKSATQQPLVERTAARAVAAGADVLQVSEKVLAAIARRDNPQMAMGVFEQRWTPLAAIRPKDEEVYVALDRVRGPGNLGTIIRTADAVGAKGVILVGDCTDPFATETVRATMGSIFAMPLSRASAAEFLRWKASAGALVAGTHLQGAVDYRTIAWPGRPVVLLMGNEQAGLPPELALGCEALARIPQAGRADSLNLAVATGVMLFEIRRHTLKLEPTP